MADCDTVEMGWRVFEYGTRFALECGGLAVFLYQEG